MNTNKSIYRLFRLIQHQVGKRKRRQYRWLIVIMFSVGLLEAASTAWIAIYASIFSDPQGIYSNELFLNAVTLLGIERIPDISVLLVIGAVLMAFLIVTKNAVRGVSRYLTGYYSASVSSLFGKRLMFRYLHRPYGWYLGQKGAELQQTVEWRAHVSEFLLNLLQAMSDLIIIVFLFATLLTYNFKVSGMIVVMISISAATIYILTRRKLRHIAARLKKYIQQVFQEMRSALLAYKDIRIFGIERFTYGRYRRPIEEAVKVHAAKAFWVGAPMLLLESLGFVALAALILIMVYINNASSGEALSMLALMAVTAWRVLPALNRLLSSQTRIQVNIPFIQTVMDMVGNDDEELFFESGNMDIESFESMELKDMSFLYPNTEHPALVNVNLTFTRGEKLGIIGASGSGKTTMVDIVTGLLAPTDGSILLNGREMSEYRLQSWKNRISYIPQKVHLVSGGLDENIAFGLDRDSIVKEHMRWACDQAALSEFINSSEIDGDLSTIIQDDGKNLSGGQVQRIGVARMFYRSNDFWIVDEGTASLDRENEKHILDNMFSDDQRTILFITHRLETLKHCDRIIVIDSGRIVKDGPGEELLPTILDSELIYEDEDES